ncbi:hypothetical protein CBR_g48432 [Chara braunii]|uniref:Isochorismatase-like domain-containing protein n=1 Tax=Chara braunii TaxID=69332 RepID=A0A388M2L3_CHABU|nr:hypothetical protein CBR_g48432 [Chara braunii]|eukprot:GBG88817.1 hypothetical protein CBR_g48432 [Chara braunii]
MTVSNARSSNWRETRCGGGRRTSWRETSCVGGRRRTVSKARSWREEDRVEGKEFKLAGNKLRRPKEQEEATGDVAFGHSLRREALLVIDMQRDFCLPSAPLFVAGAPAILPVVREAVAMARERGVVVVWVVRVHDPSGVDVERSRRGLFRSGRNGGNGGVCVEGSEGARLVDGLVSEDDDVVVVKKRWSGFLFTQLDLVLRRLGITDLVLAGIQTPNCVRATAFDAVALDYRTVSVLRDATAAASPDVHDANLFDMRNVGIATPTVAEWVSSSGWEIGCQAE